MQAQQFPSGATRIQTQGLLRVLQGCLKVTGLQVAHGQVQKTSADGYGMLWPSMARWKTYADLSTTPRNVCRGAWHKWLEFQVEKCQKNWWTAYAITLNQANLAKNNFWGCCCMASWR